VPERTVLRPFSSLGWESAYAEAPAQLNRGEG